MRVMRMLDHVGCGCGVVEVVHVGDADATYKKALAAGSLTVDGQEPSDKDYGRTCGVKDPFGNTWWITSIK